MHKLRGLLILFVCVVLLVPCVLMGKQMLTIRIWLFQGTSMEGGGELKQPEILPLSSTPQLASLKDLSAGPEDQFKAAAIDALLDAKNLRTLDDLFLVKQTQADNLPFPPKVVLGRESAFRIDLAYKILPSSQAAFRILISKTKEGIIRPEKNERLMLRKAYEATEDDEKMDTIVGQEVALRFNDPVVVGVPARDGAYFMIVKLTADEPEPKRRTAPTLKIPPLPNLVPAPDFLSRVLPNYPTELRRRGIRGDVGLRITVDEKGSVRMVQVVSPLQPYLDYAASQAFWEWKFEPVLRGGKAIPAAFEYTFTFGPQNYPDEAMHTIEIPAAGDEAGRAEMQTILAGCAEYCRKLADAALFYTCDETISETNHYLKAPDQLAQARFTYDQVIYEDARGWTGVLVDRPQIMDRRKIERLTYDCDYQLIRRFGDIEERRIVLKDNGRKITDRVDLLTDERYVALSPIVSMLKLLDKDHQALFNFRVLKEEKVSGREAYVIEAVPKLGDADGVQSAKVWVDKAGFQILKSEIEGVPLDGYDDVLNEAVLLNVKPLFVRTYDFRVEKSGVMFPDRTKVLIEYPSIRPNSRETKSKIELNYKNFKFFKVESEEEIKK
jgi:TonB family protein